jgi:hypothetical protein
MTALTWKSANFQMLSEPQDSKNALVVVPWSKFGTRRLYVDTADGQHVGWVDLKTGHCALAMPALAPAFELALAAAEHAPMEAADAPKLVHAHEFARLAGQVDNTASEPPTVMRHAYRGTSAYSSWDLGPRGTRLFAEDNDQLGSLDPHLAYLNPSSVATLR